MKKIFSPLKFSPLILFIIFLFSCKPGPQETKEATIVPQKTQTIIREIRIITFADFPLKRAQKWKKQLSEVFPKVNIITTKVPFPKEAWYAPRRRYLAVELLKYMQKTTPPGSITLGLTNQDISTWKNNQNWGIIGLSFCPGKVCVVSTYRLNKKNPDIQGVKACLHELGHSEGLKHCPNKTCLMRDARGKNHFDELNGFCEKCGKVLREKGWRVEKIEF